MGLKHLAPHVGPLHHLIIFQSGQSVFLSTEFDILKSIDFDSIIRELFDRKAARAVFGIGDIAVGRFPLVFVEMHHVRCIILITTCSEFANINILYSYMGASVAL